MLLKILKLLCVVDVCDEAFVNIGALASSRSWRWSSVVLLVCYFLLFVLFFWVDLWCCIYL